jgi:hypothetical protein
VGGSPTPLPLGPTVTAMRWFPGWPLPPAQCPQTALWARIREVGPLPFPNPSSGRTAVPNSSPQRWGDSGGTLFCLTPNGQVLAGSKSPTYGRLMGFPGGLIWLWPWRSGVRVPSLTPVFQ